MAELFGRLTKPPPSFGPNIQTQRRLKITSLASRLRLLIFAVQFVDLHSAHGTNWNSGARQFYEFKSITRDFINFFHYTFKTGVSLAMVDGNHWTWDTIWAHSRWSCFLKLLVLILHQKWVDPILRNNTDARSKLESKEVRKISMLKSGVSHNLRNVCGRESSHPPQLKKYDRYSKLELNKILNNRKSINTD